MPSQVSSSFATTVGRNIKDARTLRGLTQRQVAEAIDADPMQVSKWERGWHRPSDANLLAIANVLGKSAAWFYTDHTSAEQAA